MALSPGMPTDGDVSGIIDTGTVDNSSEDTATCTLHTYASGGNTSVCRHSNPVAVSSVGEGAVSNTMQRTVDTAGHQQLASVSVNRALITGDSQELGQLRGAGRDDSSTGLTEDIARLSRDNSGSDVIKDPNCNSWQEINYPKTCKYSIPFPTKKPTIPDKSMYKLNVETDISNSIHSSTANNVCVYVNPRDVGEIITPGKQEKYSEKALDKIVPLPLSSNCCWQKFYGLDDYDHLDPHLVYVETSIPGPGIDLAMFHQTPRGCVCSGKCQKANKIIRNIKGNENTSDCEKSSRNFSDADSKMPDEVSSNCTCLTRSRAHYIGGLLSEDCLRWPVYECNDDCTCGDDCSNRLVQRGPRNHLKVVRVANLLHASTNYHRHDDVPEYKSEGDFNHGAVCTNSTKAAPAVIVVPNCQDKGLGVITTEFIPKGSFVCEYAGEIIGEEIAKQRFSVQETEGTSNYIMVLREFYPGNKTSDHNGILSDNEHNGILPDNDHNEFLAHNKHINQKATTSNCLESCAGSRQITIIDPTCIGNIGRYLNHSCDPNVHVIPVRVHSFVPVAAMFTLRDVMPGDELVYDYASLDTRHTDLTQIRNSDGNKKRKRVSDEISATSPQVVQSEPLNPKFGSTGCSDHHSTSLTVASDPTSPSCPPLSADTTPPSVVPLRRCYCGATNCRGYLPFQQNIF